MESLTLLPPADSPHLHPCASHISTTLQRPDAPIAEEEEDYNDEKEGDWKGKQREEEELKEEDVEKSLMDETDVTVKEETTSTELVTPTDEAPQEPKGGNVAEDEEPVDEDIPLGAHRDRPSAAQLQVRDNSTATESAEKTDDTEIHTETPDSLELD